MTKPALTGLGTAAVLACALAVAGAPAARAEAPLKGTVGVCVRWDGDPAHVEEAVIVRPSRNAALNEVIPGQIRAMDWPKPATDYSGQWMGVNLVFGDAPPYGQVPSCEALNRGQRPH
ncbi:MAG TPA: hypothetical protein VII63_08415 [Caulobacteraceae bacterium]